MSQELVASMCVPLPEEIRRLVEAGYLQEARESLEWKLKGELPEMLRRRFQCEIERLGRMTRNHEAREEDMLKEFLQAFPNASPDDFRTLEMEGKISFLFVNGEKRYFKRAVRTLIRDSEVRRRFGLPVSPENPELDGMIREAKEKGSVSRRIALELVIGPEEASFVPDTYRAWLPVPISCAQQSEISVEAGDARLSGEDAPLRTVFWEKQLMRPERFTARVDYRSTIQYTDPMDTRSGLVYPRESAPGEADLKEDGVVIRFTPFLRELCRQVMQGTRSDVERAWKAYEYVTTHVRYSFVRDYFLLEDLGEFCAVNLRGDCGLQAILFIELCRLAGVPARWQSGLCVEDGEVGHHDWAMFWSDRKGWLFADCSFGGSAWRCGAVDRHRFYFGNIDPQRMAANRVCFAPMDPPAQRIRHDPFDNQGGELERDCLERGMDCQDIFRDARLILCES